MINIKLALILCVLTIFFVSAGIIFATTTPIIATTTEYTATSTDDIATTTDNTATSTEEMATSTEDIATTTMATSSVVSAVTTPPDDGQRPFPLNLFAPSSNYYSSGAFSPFMTRSLVLAGFSLALLGMMFLFYGGIPTTRFR